MTSLPSSPIKLRPEIASMQAYRQGRPAAEGGFKLSSNENPFEPLPGVLEAVAAVSSFNRYPDGTALALRERLAARHGVAVDEVHVGAGSISLLTQLVTAVAGSGDEVIYPWRSFEAYPGIVVVAGATSVAIPNAAGEVHDIESIAAAVTDRTRAVIICSPNNPTGAIVTADQFEWLMSQIPSDVLVILDEAYAEFNRNEAAVRGAELIGRYPNMVLLRTFSKAWGLAGLRIGYAIGNSAILSAARSAAIALSVTDQAQTAALVSLDHEEALLERVAHIVERRDAVVAGLTAQGWKLPETQGNFVWLATGEATAAAADLLQSHGITARAFHPEGLRVSIGEHESVDKLLRATKDVVENLLQPQS